MKSYFLFILILIILSMIMMGMGGYLDMTGQEKITIYKITISKQHFWLDGIYLLILSCFFVFYHKK